MKNKIEITSNELSKRIYTLRGVQVMLDADLAAIYEVEPRALKQAVKRNAKRFPTDFMFEPTNGEPENLRSQIVISSLENSSEAGAKPILRSQSVISSFEEPAQQHGGSRYTSLVFTESGIAMLSSVLHSPRAVQINIEIMRAFVQLRKQPRVDMDMILQRLDGLEVLLRGQKPSAPSFVEHEPVRLIQNAVAKYWGITIEDLKSARRAKEISLPRQIAIYLIKKRLHLSLNDIGRHFGQRDHSTILHAYRKIDAASGSNSIIKRAIDSLQRQIA